MLSIENWFYDLNSIFIFDLPVLVELWVAEDGPIGAFVGQGQGPARGQPLLVLQDYF